jgi:hypothetical protein
MTLITHGANIKIRTVFFVLEMDSERSYIFRMTDYFEFKNDK